MDKAPKTGIGWQEMPNRFNYLIPEKQKPADRSEAVGGFYRFTHQAVAVAIS